MIFLASKSDSSLTFWAPKNKFALKKREILAVFQTPLYLCKNPVNANPSNS
jgi:hypothetical protein